MTWSARRFPIIAALAATLGAATPPAAAQSDVPCAELGPPTSEAPQAATSLKGKHVTLRGIDKLTGDVKTVEAEAPGLAQMWRMEIKVAACFKRPAERAPESSAFLQIYDTKPQPYEQLFSGWMFASSPALSAMDHPRYDVWVINCSTS